MEERKPRSLRSTFFLPENFKHQSAGFETSISHLSMSQKNSNFFEKFCLWRGQTNGRRTVWVSVRRIPSCSGLPTSAVVAGALSRVKEWKVEYQHDGAWHEAVKGTTIGEKLEVTLPKPVTAQKFRLSLKANDRTAIREWQMF
jgi:hypothetical protein